MVNSSFWKNKKVFITGHTGFKGAWLSMWLHELEAKITGYALTPPTIPSLYKLTNIDNIVTSHIHDIRDQSSLEKALLDTDPDIIFHLAAQPLVRDSYRNPVETYETNVLGTVYLLESLRKISDKKKKKRAFINVTTDKCYENKEWYWGYRETDSLGGFDPYSNSKACSELATSSYQKAFFPVDQYENHKLAIATARAGNVIGGGDWSEERLIPDCIRSLLEQKTIQIRNLKAIRPWQHVLEPLSGYLLLAQKLYEDGPLYNGAWNFGPNDHDCRPVQFIVEKLCEKWGKDARYADKSDNQSLHEAQLLKLDCSKAKQKLRWQPRWNLDQAIEKIIEWTKGYEEKQDLAQISLKQIREFSLVER